VLVKWVFCLASAAGATAGDWQRQLLEGVRARESGNIFDSILILELVVQHAPDQASRVGALTQLEKSLGQAGRFGEATTVLESAYQQAAGPAKEEVALALGNVGARAREGSGPC
jgi:hypothetical protein